MVLRHGLLVMKEGSPPVNRMKEKRTSDEDCKKFFDIDTGSTPGREEEKEAETPMKNAYLQHHDLYRDIKHSNGAKL